MLNYSIRILSLMAPIDNGSVLLPNANIAEVVQYKEPEYLKGAPDWLFGFLPWREIKVPLVAYEAIIGGEIPPLKGSTKWILILNALGGKADLPFFAILVQGKPSLIQVDESVVTPMTVKATDGVLRHVHVDGEPATIPDLDFIEKLICDFRDQYGANKAS